MQNMTKKEIIEEIDVKHVEREEITSRINVLYTELVMRKYKVHLGEIIEVLISDRYGKKTVKAVVTGGSTYLYVKLFTKSGAISKVNTIIYKKEHVTERGLGEVV